MVKQLIEPGTLWRLKTLNEIDYRGEAPSNYALVLEAPSPRNVKVQDSEGRVVSIEIEMVKLLFDSSEVTDWTVAGFVSSYEYV